MDIEGLLEMGRSFGLDGEVFPEAIIGFLEGLPAVHVAPIVSVSCNLRPLGRISWHSGV